jgi:anti-anti-sigma factor
MFQFEAQGAVELLAPDVALTHENVEQLSGVFAEKQFAGQPMVVLDMSKVPLLDSAGLETLLDIQHQLRASAGALKLAGLTPLCADVFRVTGLEQRFDLYDDSKAAVRSFVR